MLERASICLSSGANQCLKCRARSLGNDGLNTIRKRGFASSSKKRPITSDASPSTKFGLKRGEITCSFLYPPSVWLGLGSNHASYIAGRAGRGIGDRPLSRSKCRTFSRRYSSCPTVSSHEERPMLDPSIAYMRSTVTRPDQSKYTSPADVENHSRTSDAPKQASLHTLRRLLHVTLSQLRQDPSHPSHSATVERAWKMYLDIEKNTPTTVRFKKRLLYWLSLHNQVDSARKVLAVLPTIPADDRDGCVYTRAVLAALRLGLTEQAVSLYAESGNVPMHRSQLACSLTAHAIAQEDWPLAVRYQHDCRNDGENGLDNRLCVMVNKIPFLLAKSHSLLCFISTEGNSLASSGFARSLFGEVLKFGIQQDLTPPTYGFSRASYLPAALPKSHIQQVLDRINSYAADAPTFFDSVLHQLLHDPDRFPADCVHDIVTRMFEIITSHSNYQIQIGTWEALSRRLLEMHKTRQDPAMMSGEIALIDFYKIWEGQYGKLPKHIYRAVLIHFADIGYQAEFEAWAEKFIAAYDDYAVRKDTYSLRIHMHARRGEHRQAKQVFNDLWVIARNNSGTVHMKAWSSLILASARSDNLKRARKILEQMEGHGVVPDAYCVQPVLEMLSKRGLPHSVQKLIRRYRSNHPGKILSTDLYAPLIVAYLKTGAFQQALLCLRWLHQKLKKNQLKGTLTIHYNRVLTDLAIRRDVTTLVKAFAAMRRRGVPAEAATYGPLLLALTLHRRTDDALQMMHNDMKAAGLRPTALHYGIIMNGFYREGEFARAVQTYDDMKDRNVPRTHAVEATLLKAQLALSATLGDHAETNKSEMEINKPHEIYEDFSGVNALTKNSQRRGPPPRLATHANDMLKTSLAKDVQRITARSPATAGRLDSDNITDSDPDIWFESLVSELTKSQRVLAALNLANMYPSAKDESTFSTKNPSILLLTNIMEAFARLGDFKAVDQIWRGILGRVSRTGPKMPTPILTPAQVAEVNRLFGDIHQPKQWFVPRKKPWVARRTILSRPVTIYIQALAAQDRHSDILLLVSRMLVLGYALESSAWNQLIRCLCTAQPPRVLLAFTLTERFLIQGFTGWAEEPRSPQTGEEASTMNHMMYLKPSRSSSRTLVPQWPTILALHQAANQLNDAATRMIEDPDVRKYVGTRELLIQYSPHTLKVVQSIPSYAEISDLSVFDSLATNTRVRSKAKVKHSKIMERNSEDPGRNKISRSEFPQFEPFFRRRVISRSNRKRRAEPANSPSKTSDHNISKEPSVAVSQGDKTRSSFKPLTWPSERKAPSLPGSESAKKKRRWI